jgi:hypothetical protein
VVNGIEHIGTGKAINVAINHLPPTINRLPFSSRLDDFNFANYSVMFGLFTKRII